MLKGTQKKVVIIKDTKSGIFDEAYFILKNNTDVSVQTRDMVAEANRIINCSVTENAEGDLLKNSGISLHQKRAEKYIRPLWFSLGVLFCCGIFAATLVLLGYS